MVAEFSSLIAFFGGAVIAMIASGQSLSKAVRLQQEILQRGVAAQGRILRIWRPPLLGACTRVYFEFEPPGSRRCVQTCHVDRRTGEAIASLPVVGASVAVRFLPEQPTRAVIAKLVSRFGR